MYYRSVAHSAQTLVMRRIDELPAPLAPLGADALRHMVLTRYRVPMRDPQPLIRRRQPLPGAARVEGVRHREHAIQAVHRSTTDTR